MIKKLFVITLFSACLSFAGDFKLTPELINTDDLSRKGKILYQVGKIKTAIGLLTPFVIVFDALNKEWKPGHVVGLVGCAGFVTLGQIHIELGKKIRNKIKG